MEGLDPEGTSGIPLCSYSNTKISTCIMGSEYPLDSGNRNGCLTGPGRSAIVESVYRSRGDVDAVTAGDNTSLRTSIKESLLLIGNTTVTVETFGHIG